MGLCHGLDDEGGTVVHVVGFHWRTEFYMILSRDKLGINDKKHCSSGRKSSVGPTLVSVTSDPNNDDTRHTPLENDTNLINVLGFQYIHQCTKYSTFNK